MGSVISKATYDLVWQAFTKWTQAELDKGRAVNVAGFGIIGYEELRDNMRIPFIKLSENFLGSHGLEYKPEMADFRRVKTDIKTQPAYASIAKSVDVEKGTFQTVLGNIFQVTGELLSEGVMVDVDLGELGKFISSGRQLIY